MFCEHRLKLDKVEWNGRRCSQLKQQPTKALFICVDCKSVLIFNYSSIVVRGDCYE